MPEIRPVKTFTTAVEFRQWLARHHAKSAGIWLRIARKHAGRKTVSYAEALDEALCFGWIDGQKARCDEDFWLQKFTPRRTKSLWSKRNREHIARLIKEKRMTPAGLAAVDAAIADGRWDSAYDSGRTTEVPEDFITELKEDKTAYAFFLTLNKANTYAIAWRLQTAKRPETRHRRKAQLLAQMKARKPLH